MHNVKDDFCTKDNGLLAGLKATKISLIALSRLNEGRVSATHASIYFEWTRGRLCSQNNVRTVNLHEE